MTVQISTTMSAIGSALQIQRDYANDPRLVACLDKHINALFAGVRAPVVAPVVAVKPASVVRVVEEKPSGDRLHADKPAHYICQTPKGQRPWSKSAPAPAVSSPVVREVNAAIAKAVAETPMLKPIKGGSWETRYELRVGKRVYHVSTRDNASKGNLYLRVDLVSGRVAKSDKGLFLDGLRSGSASKGSRKIAYFGTREDMRMLRKVFPTVTVASK